MIVNPQLFNYRLITGSLIVALAVLSIFSFDSYQNSQATQEFLEQERKLISYELKEIIDQYESVSVENQELQSEISVAKSMAQQALDSIDILEGDIAVYSKYKQQVYNFRKQNSELLNSVKNLEEEFQVLQAEHSNNIKLLQAEELENEALKLKNAELSSSLVFASRLRASNFQVKAFTVSKEKQIETRRAINAENIEVCLTILDNELIESGNKDLYIQIVNPSNNVVADKGAVTFDDASLIYSAKNTFYYNQDSQDICISVKADPEDMPLQKGTYYVSVFHGAQKIASTQLVLD